MEEKEKERMLSLVEEMLRCAERGEMEKARFILRRIENRLIFLMVKARGDDRKRNWKERGEKVGCKAYFSFSPSFLFFSPEHRSRGGDLR